MSHLSRRGFVLASAATLSACADSSFITPTITPSREKTDRRVESALAEMYQFYPNSRKLADISKGMLVMPKINEAGFVVGGTYGEGALLINDVTVDYYSYAGATVGFQAGAQIYRHVLFFLTEHSLTKFRTGNGWTMGADVEYAILKKGQTFRVDTDNVSEQIYAVIFDNKGLIAGATLDGSRYTRVNR